MLKHQRELFLRCAKNLFCLQLLIDYPPQPKLIPVIVVLWVQQIRQIKSTPYSWAWSVLWLYFDRNWLTATNNTIIVYDNWNIKLWHYCSISADLDHALCACAWNLEQSDINMTQWRSWIRQYSIWNTFSFNYWYWSNASVGVTMAAGSGLE